MSAPRGPILHLDPVVRDFLHTLDATGLNSKKIAAQAGIHASDLSFWRSGARTPTRERMKLVLIALGLPPELTSLRPAVAKAPDPVAPVYQPRPGLSRAERMTAVFAGDPPLGRSALDQRAQG
jgi:transcriptional regulator with XRE-family HTH domain